jgi:hypothetical protein
VGSERQIRSTRGINIRRTKEWRKDWSGLTTPSSWRSPAGMVPHHAHLPTEKCPWPFPSIQCLILPATQTSPVHPEVSRSARSGDRSPRQSNTLGSPDWSKNWSRQDFVAWLEMSGRRSTGRRPQPRDSSNWLDCRSAREPRLQSQPRRSRRRWRFVPSPSPVLEDGRLVQYANLLRRPASPTTIGAEGSS